MAYRLLKDVIDIKMLYKNKKSPVLSQDNDNNFHDIVTGVLKGDVFETYMHLICLHYALLTSVDVINHFDIKKDKKQTISGRKFAVDLAFFANTLSQVKSLLDRREKVGYISFYVNPY